VTINYKTKKSTVIIMNSKHETPELVITYRKATNTQRVSPSTTPGIYIEDPTTIQDLCSPPSSPFTEHPIADTSSPNHDRAFTPETEYYETVSEISESESEVDDPYAHHHIDDPKVWETPLIKAIIRKCAKAHYERTKRVQKRLIAKSRRSIEKIIEEELYSSNRRQAISSGAKYSHFRAGSVSLAKRQKTATQQSKSK